MRNLAGREDCDQYIRDELQRADIEVVEVPKSTSEVPYTLEGRLQGKLKEYTFQRCWTYWVVHGNVGLKVAEWLYDHPEGRQTVRVRGDCGCPPPSDAVEHNYYTNESYVSTYHIDSQAGLLLFVLAVTGKLRVE